MSQIYREMTDDTVDLGTVICSCRLWICIEKTKLFDAINYLKACHTGRMR